MDRVKMHIFLFFQYFNSFNDTKKTECELLLQGMYLVPPKFDLYFLHHSCYPILSGFCGHDSTVYVDYWFSSEYMSRKKTRFGTFNGSYKTTLPKVINLPCSINTFYTINENSDSGVYLRKWCSRSVTQFWPTWSIFKKLLRKNLDENQ